MTKVIVVAGIGVDFNSLTKVKEEAYPDQEAVALTFEDINYLVIPENIVAGGLNKREYIAMTCLHDHISNTPTGELEIYEAGCYTARHWDEHIDCHCSLDDCTPLNIYEEHYGVNQIKMEVYRAIPNN